MKVLIVDDSQYKINNVIRVLAGLGIKDYKIVNYVVEAIRVLKQENFDLIIADLGLPRYSNELIHYSLEGLHMLFDLAFDEIFVPTIVYSTTEIPDQASYLIDDEYPFLGQAKDIGTLQALISKKINEAPEDKKTFVKL